MRVVAEPSGLLAAIRTARSEAGAAFGDTSVYLERRLARPRHIEIQLLGDHFGTVVPFVERECSIQRRHQKVVEESPSICRRARRCARRWRLPRPPWPGRSDTPTRARSSSCSTSRRGRSFYFLEMNTRLQVEHPVTEMVTGVDLVHWQIRIARGERLDVDPVRALTPRGHAIECRIYAEDPDQGFMPAPGAHPRAASRLGPRHSRRRRRERGLHRAGVLRLADRQARRLGRLRATARSRGWRARCEEYQVLGIRTTIPFFVWLMRQTEYRDGRTIPRGSIGSWLSGLSGRVPGNQLQRARRGRHTARGDGGSDRRVHSRA